MDRYAIFVDAGYLLSQAVKIVSLNKSNNRSDLNLLDADGLIAMLRAQASTLLGNSNILRTYWYDGVSGGLSPEHRKIVNVEDVLLRTGTINKSGHQKGVDSKIVTDLVELATSRAICDALVVSGDADIAVGIELAMHRGVRVAVLGLEDTALPIPHNQSPEIVQLADRSKRIDGSCISTFFAYQPKTQTAKTSSSLASVSQGPAIMGAPPASRSTSKAPSTATPLQAGARSTPSNKPAIDASIRAFLSTFNPPLTVASAIGPLGITYDIDRKLLFAVMHSLGNGALSENEKRYTRDEFRRLLP